MVESTYDLCLFYKCGLFEIMGIQTDNTLILADNNFARKKKAAIKVVKIMTKDWRHFTFIQPLKFNEVQIKLDSKSIVLTKKSHIGGIFLVIDHNIDSISFKRVTKKKLLAKKQHLVQKAIGAYIAFMC